jgi:protein disulfide-isomerase A1
MVCLPVSTKLITYISIICPRCGHCKALAPHYEEAATALKDKEIKLAKVDCVEEADLCQAHGVAGYPYVTWHMWFTTQLHAHFRTLKVFRNGTPGDYNGPRKADGIISYMVKCVDASEWKCCSDQSVPDNLFPQCLR